MESTPKLAAKMVLAMKSIDAVAKTGKNVKQGYDYVKAADVANEVRAALTEHGIAFDYDVVSEERWDRPTSSGGSMACMQVKVGCTFTDQESGESRTVHSIGWGMDSLDKAPYKAMTGALKYALRMTFLIPDDADPENDSNGNGHPQPDVQRASRPSPTTPENYDAEPPPEVYDNEYDAHMQPKPQVRKQGPVISEAQAKRFFGIAMGSGKTKEQINNYVAIKGYNHSSEFLKSEYEDHCAWAAAK
jgi:hypothetical protein